MTFRPLVSVAIAALLLAPGAARAAMGFGDPEAPQVTFTTPPSAAVGQPSPVGCSASDPQGIAQITIDAKGPDGVLVVLASVAGPGPLSTSWTPAAAGSHTLRCTAKDAYSGAGIALSTTVTRVITASVAPPGPTISALEAAPATVLAGASSSITASATDPSAGTLSFAWTATAGTLEGSGPTVRWTAPQRAGVFVVKVTATSSASGVSSSAEVAITVRLAEFQSQHALPMAAPRRLCAAADGQLVALDAVQHGGGRALLLTARGEARGAVALPEPAAAVACGDGLAWIVTERGSIVPLDLRTGRALPPLPLEPGSLVQPSGVALDPAASTLWVADVAADLVRVLTLDGTTVAVIREAGGAPLRSPVDVAFDVQRGQAWVVVGGAKTALATGEPAAAARIAHRFARDGRYLASAVPAGGGAGQVTRGGGVAVGAGGRLHVADAFQGSVSVFDALGVALGTIGTYGDAAGQLTNPAGLAFMTNGDLLVANTTLSRLERFGAGAALPTCEGDADCDGLDDAWELAHGLDPAWAGDALLDLDGDGLNAAEELALGTDPRRRDTDGDGFPDDVELASGHDPLDPDDHRPVLVLSGPREMTPGVAHLSATVSGAGSCGVAWAQVGGPAGVLRGRTTQTPELVARAAGTYELEAVATCGGQQSRGRLALTVTNVAPVADAGRILVVAAGSPFVLDAEGSSDANGDALAYQWDQSLGVPLAGATPGPTLVARAAAPGLYRFLLTAVDGAGAASEAEVPVLVVAGETPTAAATSAPASPSVGAQVVLDATASRANAGAGFEWVQVAGPAVTLAGASGPVAAFVPAEPGRHGFEVTVVSRGVRSPPARVDVFVAAAGEVLPVARAQAPQVVPVATEVALDGGGSAGAGLDFAWRQVSGPAAGLRDADRAVATAVAFEPGFYVFELVVRSGAAESRPARVAFEARAGGAPIPVARIAPVAAALVGRAVTLDGLRSAGAARFRWTQVAGPWVAVQGADGPVLQFIPRATGRYAFELVVDDGAVRSAPARVQIDVAGGDGGVR